MLQHSASISIQKLRWIDFRGASACRNTCQKVYSTEFIERRIWCTNFTEGFIEWKYADVFKPVLEEDGIIGAKTRLQHAEYLPCDTR